MRRLDGRNMGDADIGPLTNVSRILDIDTGAD